MKIMQKLSLTKLLWQHRTDNDPPQIREIATQNASANHNHPVFLRTSQNEKQIEKNRIVFPYGTLPCAPSAQ